MSDGEPANPPREAAPAGREKPRPSWFGALARLWCLKAVDAAPHGSPVVAILVMSLSWLTAWIVIDRWQRQPDPEFYIDGIPLLGWYALAIVALAGVLRGASRPRPGLGATLVLSLGVAPLPVLLVAVVAYYLEPPWFWCAGGAAVVYVAVYLLRGLRAVTGRSQRTAALLGIIFIAAFMVLSDAVDAIPDVWNPRDSSDSVPNGVLAEREAVLFEQADRIDESLEAVHRDGSELPEAFFLGFAGVGDQKVFAQEIDLAARVVGKRFGTGDRQITLINDERDLERAPLASVYGLTYALQGIASRMNLEKDVLFLSISSHGSADPVIAVSNSQFPFKSLDRGDLADALHDAGIKWRVIILSACYAGGFIDALRDPQTIIITAAAADRTSFGCSNDSDLTYFGEAFYRDALPGARTLRDAFDAAKIAIAARERREKVTASNPQAYFGSEIESKLAAMSGPASRPAATHTR
ncbi:MAG: hypothetical protein JWN43_770 [Gammaproteobacteria bacterium]|nr:hypothetical protein [Gammaproteobacteria bacterium]